MKTLIRCLIAAVLLTGLLCSAAEITYRPESGSLSHVVIDGRTAYGYQHNRKPPLEDTSIPLYTRHGDYLENDALSQTDLTLRPQIAALLQAGASADGYRLIEKHRLAEAVEWLQGTYPLFEEPLSLESITNTVTQYTLWILLDPSQKEKYENAIRIYGDAFWEYYQDLYHIAEKGELLSNTLTVHTADGKEAQFHWDGAGYTTNLLYAVSDIGGSLEVSNLPEGIQVLDEDGRPFGNSIPVGVPFAFRCDREIRQPLLFRLRHRYHETQIWFYQWQSEKNQTLLEEDRYQDLIAVDVEGQSVVAFKELAVSPPVASPTNNDTTSSSSAASTTLPTEGPTFSGTRPPVPTDDTDTGEDISSLPLFLFMISIGIITSYIQYFDRKFHISRIFKEKNH